MEIVELGFSFFRSIGEEPVFVHLTKKVNILIGANNSGKSNVIRALQWIQPKVNGLVGTGKMDEPLETDAHQRDEKNAFSLTVRATVTHEDGFLHPPEAPVQFQFILKEKTFECVSTPFTSFDNAQIYKLAEHVHGKRPSRGIPSHERKVLEQDASKAAVREALKAQLPPIQLVPEFRQIRGGTGYSLDGKGIIATLAAWKRPKIGDEGDEKRFLRMQDLLRDLLHMPSVELDVPHDNSRIIVARDSLRLPLESYGTGVHELIILAIAVHSRDDSMFCIEEPEIHLHPRLQKEFLKFLISSTKNKYVLTTHSNALLSPSNDVQVTHLWMEDGATRGRAVDTSAKALAVLADLGVQASDLLQANSVVWVEGPSDRIYINHCLQLLAPELQEHVDYSIMFYGGSLLSHVSMERDAELTPDQLVALLRINQNSIIVIDSDREEQTDKINATKARIRRECENNDLLCWITWGREIENYLPATSIIAAYEEITGMPLTELSFHRFDRLEDSLDEAYGEKWRSSWSYSDAKPAKARCIVEHITEADIRGELAKSLRKLVRAIGRSK